MTLPGSPISSEHVRRVCEPRWIDHAGAERAGLRSVDNLTGRELVGRNGAGRYEGIAIPFRWPGDSYVRDWLIRRDHPEFEEKADGTKKPRGKYLCPPGRGNLLYVPADVDAGLLKDTSTPLWITEGPLKAIALWRAAWFGLGDGADKPRALPIAINGVWGFRGVIGKDVDADGARVDVKGVISDLSRIEVRRLVVILYDNDVEKNQSVQKARREFTRELQERGATVGWFPWPKHLPDCVKGIDDFLAARGPEETLKLIAGARARRQRKSPSTVEAPSKEGPRPLTELGNAERLVTAYGEGFRHCGSQRSFLIHDGRRWIDDELGQMERWAKATVRAIYQEAADLDDLSLRTATAEWAKRSEKAAQLAAMIRLAASEAGVPVLPSDLDADPMLFNVANGTIDLRTGALRPHCRQDLVTRLAPVEYDPAAKCPRWLRFLSEVFASHPDVIPFMQLAAGYSLTADTREECLLLLHGVGRNGKGTLLKVLAAVMGDYAGTADFSTFVATRDDRSPRDDIANMKGRRLISAQEAREGAPLAESIVKWLTGGDRVRARKLHENSYEFDPTWKIWLATNYKPTIRGQDPAIWSRIRLVPFDVSFQGREDRTLKATLLGELPGVLAWAVEGCLRWQAKGLLLPDSVTKATDDYRSESDQVARFIDGRCIVGEYVSALGRPLYAAYKAWTEETGEREHLTETAFGKRLTDGHHFEKKHTDRGTLYLGIGLRTDL